MSGKPDFKGLVPKNVDEPVVKGTVSVESNIQDLIAEDCMLAVEAAKQYPY